MDHHLLFIRDDVWSIRYVIELLRDRGYTVTTASNFEFAADPGLADSFDLLLIDHAEPRVNAMDICAELRQRNVEVPVVVLTARGRVQDRVAILKAGANDYLLKPVDLDELHVRIEALLVRSVRSKSEEISCYEFGGMQMDFRKSELVRDGSSIELSEREARLLRYFVENRGKTISRNDLLQHVWGYRRAPLTRTVDVHILRLRHKIEDNPKDPRFIVTVPGFGYRFDG
ncbi:MAG TPA: response regulator transcription factor [Terriglobia bacterium]|nr:response regulator transcription factor [Terriglobia bacterium]